MHQSANFLFDDVLIIELLKNSLRNIFHFSVNESKIIPLMQCEDYEERAACSNSLMV